MKEKISMIISRDAMLAWERYKTSCEELSMLIRELGKHRADRRINNKWRTVFISLVIANAILWIPLIFNQQ